MQNFKKQDLRILYVASQCLFFIMTFNTENFELMVGREKKYHDKEALLVYLYEIIREKDEDYRDLIFYLEEYVDDAHDTLTFGVYNIAILTKGQYAANLLLDFEVLKRPFSYPKAPCHLADEF